MTHLFTCAVCGQAYCFEQLYGCAVCACSVCADCLAHFERVPVRILGYHLIYVGVILCRRCIQTACSPMDVSVS